jgi:hypothetical protein
LHWCLGQFFDDLVAQAREHGLIKDRLRLNDATHIPANIAIPSTLTLAAQAPGAEPAIASADFTAGRRGGCYFRLSPVCPTFVETLHVEEAIKPF